MARVPLWAVSVIVFLAVMCRDSALARNERIPPPRTYISSGGFGDGEPWLPPDDPSGGGGDGGGYGGGGGVGHDAGGSEDGGDTGNWWNDSGFWGWGSGWWRYPDPILPSGGGGGEGGTEGNGAGTSCTSLNLDRSLLCVVEEPTGAFTNWCGCAVKFNPKTGSPQDCGHCNRQFSPADAGCWGKSEGMNVSTEIIGMKADIPRVLRSDYLTTIRQDWPFFQTP